MKKFTLLFISLLSVTYALAERISQEQARQNVVSFLSKGVPLRKHTANNIADYRKVLESNACYVFTGKSGEGFIIAAADDRMASSILGYSDTGTFDPDNIPECLKWWLSEYDKEEQWLAANPDKQQPAHKAEKPAIGPLLKSVWYQTTPFSDQCPILDGGHCPSGCVATAVAQIMYYYKWPATGEGSHSYSWNSHTLSANFSQSTYNWDAMNDTYDGNSSWESCTAVAKLMSDVGIALNTVYGETSNTDSKYVTQALENYFRYSKEACLYERTRYTSEEWEQMVYESLERKEPICYFGSGCGGHSFVCDGYNAGYYHFNWGLGSTLDGYFLLSALSPHAQDWGDSTNGFSASQEMVLNIRPDVDASTKPIAYMATNGNFSLEYNSSRKEFVMGHGFWNCTTDTINTAIGLEFVDSDGNSEFKFADQPSDCEPDGGWETFSLSKDSFPSQKGIYKVYPAYYDGNYNTCNRLHTDNYCNNYCIATVTSGGGISIKQPSYSGNITCTDASYGNFYAGKYIPITITLTNKGSDSYSNDINIGVRNSKGWITKASGFADLGPHESCTLTIRLKAPSAESKNCSLCICDAQFNTIASYAIDVVSVPTGQFEGQLTAEPCATADSTGNIIITCQLSCTSGYEEEFLACFYDLDGTYLCKRLRAGYPLGKGDSAEVTFCSRDAQLDPETTYLYNIEGHLNKYYVFLYGTTEFFQFTTPKWATGISTVSGSESTALSSPMYNLQGQRISAAAKGQIYIQNGKKVLNQ